MDKYSMLMIGRLNSVKMSVLPTLSYTFHRILVKIPASYFVGLSKLILRFIWEAKTPN